jgi:hypothetical protein
MLISPAEIAPLSGECLLNVNTSSMFAACGLFFSARCWLETKRIWNSPGFVQFFVIHRVN